MVGLFIKQMINPFHLRSFPQMLQRNAHAADKQIQLQMTAWCKMQPLISIPTSLVRTSMAIMVTCAMSRTIHKVSREFGSNQMLMITSCAVREHTKSMETISLLLKSLLQTTNTFQVSPRVEHCWLLPTQATIFDQLIQLTYITIIVYS
jgi:hypothetical protein